MTTMESAEQAGRRAARSGTLKALTRFGFLGYGLLHGLIGWLAMEISWGRHPDDGDQAGAFRTLAHQPLGRFLLIAIAVGLLAMTVWQLLAAAVGHLDKRGKRRVAERVVSGGRFVVYAALAWTALRVVLGSHESSAEQQESMTQTILAHTGGRWLVGLLGLGVVATGVGMALYGLLRKFQENLRLAQMGEAVEHTATGLALIGYVAKGIAISIMGGLLIMAALDANPNHSRGMDAALRTLARHPYGHLLLIAVAGGFFAFGAYCLFQARYRKV